MQEHAGKLKWICLLLAMSLLNGCALVGRISGVEKFNGCEWALPIPISDAQIGTLLATNNDDLLYSIGVHNETWNEICS